MHKLREDTGIATILDAKSRFRPSPCPQFLRRRRTSGSACRDEESAAGAFVIPPSQWSAKLALVAIA
ncbi:hypothetical protein LTR28_003207 [Elasticomyces elasticus]|nr:hypothetical protein LTR28_003207 [Elasticomyces elasticus]